MSSAPRTSPLRVVTWLGGLLDVTCAQCGARVPPRAQVCPRCHAFATGVSRADMNRLSWVILAAIAFAAAAGWALSAPWG